MDLCRKYRKDLASRTSVWPWRPCAISACCFSFAMRPTMRRNTCAAISKRNCWWSNWVGWIRMPKPKSICSYGPPKWTHRTLAAADFSMWIEIFSNRWRHRIYCVHLEVCINLPLSLVWPLQLLTTMVTYLVVLLQFQISIPEDQEVHVSNASNSSNNAITAATAVSP